MKKEVMMKHNNRTLTEICQDINLTRLGIGIDFRTLSDLTDDIEYVEARLETWHTGAYESSVDKYYKLAFEETIKLAKEELANGTN